jgi:hypothetical protein
VIFLNCTARFNILPTCLISLLVCSVTQTATQDGRGMTWHHAAITPCRTLQARLSLPVGPFTTRACHLGDTADLGLALCYNQGGAATCARSAQSAKCAAQTCPIQLACRPPLCRDMTFPPRQHCELAWQFCAPRFA